MPGVLGLFVPEARNTYADSNQITFLYGAIIASFTLYSILALS
jgi:arginine exporter protein ArgO